MDRFCVGRTYERRGNAAAGAGLPEVHAISIWSIAVLGVKGRSLVLAIRTNVVANAPALVVLPVMILATAWVKANALSSSPSESSRAGSRERFTRTISDVEPLRKMASWGVSVSAFAQNCVTVLGRSVAFSL